MIDKFNLDSLELEDLERLEEINMPNILKAISINNNKLLTIEERLTKLFGYNPYVVDENGVRVTQAIID